MAYNEKCDPLKNHMNVPILPPIPGLKGFTADLNFPTLGLDLPDGIPEDLLDWIRRLKFNLPGGGLLQEILESLQETIAEIISHLLGFLNMFLAFYNFIMAIIEIIMCIINVLTAAMNPLKMIKRIKCLIRKCLPIFITIVFPFLALLLLLLNLLALLLALIEYIINLIKRLIEQLLKNIRRLKMVLRDGNANAALAVISKFSDLLCLFEHVFVLLSVIDLIITIIKGKWDKTFKKCNGSSNESGNILSADDICASFLREPTELVDEDLEIWKLRMQGTAGSMWYCNEVYGAPFPLFPATSVALLRNESVYISDNSLPEALRFSNVIKYKPLNENRYYPMFPPDTTITTDMETDVIPYFIDISMNINPNDGYGARNILVQDALLKLPTKDAILEVVANVSHKTHNDYGYLLITGGNTINDPFGFNGHTIEELLQANSGLAPNTAGTGTNAQYSNVNYVVKANYMALAQYTLITMGCLPSVVAEYDYFDTVYEKPISQNLPDLVDLPDVGAAITSLNLCLSNFRANINEETIPEFETCMNDTLIDLSNQASTTYCQLLDASIDIYNIDVSLIPDFQFVTQPIEILITPMNGDKTFADLVGGFASSIDIDGCIGGNFTAKATLGTVSSFIYDGYGNFVAELSSDIAGDGYLELYYKGEQIPNVVAPNNLNKQPEISYSPFKYSFIGLFADGYAKGVAPVPRREERDIANL